VRNWIYDHRPGVECWKREKEEENDKIFQEILSSKHVKKNIEAINEIGLAIVLRVLQDVYADERKISIGEAQKLMELLSKSDHMRRLAEGEATTIIAKVDASPKGIKELIEGFKEADPYADYELDEDEKDLIQ
jgi:hypothetical protein